MASFSSYSAQGRAGSSQFRASGNSFSDLAGSQLRQQQQRPSARYGGPGAQFAASGNHFSDLAGAAGSAGAGGQPASLASVYTERAPSAYAASQYAAEAPQGAQLSRSQEMSDLRTARSGSRTQLADDGTRTARSESGYNLNGQLVLSHHLASF